MTKHSSLLISVVVLCVLLAGSALAATWYVDGQTGVDGQDGTNWTTALRTIRYPAKNAYTSPGDVVKVRGVYENYQAYTDMDGITYEGVYSDVTGYMPFIHGGTELDEAAMTNRPGYANTWMHDNATAQNTYVFTAPAGTDLADVAAWNWLTRVTVLDDVDTTTGSFYRVDNDKLYIHPPDSLDPTNFVMCQTTGNPGWHVRHQDITIQGFIIAFTWDNQGVRSYSSEPTTNIVITGCTLGPFGRLEVEGAENLEYSSNTLYRTGMIVDESVSNAVVRGNTISDYPSVGIRCTSMGTLDVSYNTVHDCSVQGIYIYDGNGDRTQVDIYGNTVYSNATVGIELVTDAEQCDINIYNNTAYDNGQNIRLNRPGSDNNNSGVASIFNNTIVNSEGYQGDDNGDAWEIHGLHIRKRPDPDETKVFNNIICQDAGDGTTNAYAISSPSSRKIVNDYNNLYVTDGALVGYYGWYGGESSCSNLAEWRTATGYGDNSISEDPGFVDQASAPKDLHITAASPCFNTGVASWQSISAPSTDIDGEARPIALAYDMGSDEHRPPQGTLFIIR